MQFLLVQMKSSSYSAVELLSVLLVAGHCSAKSLREENDPLLVPCGHSTFRNARIVGGVRTQKGQIPWQLALWRNGAQVCGAALLTENFAVTAAHCIRTNHRMKLQAGTLSLNDTGPNRQLRYVAEAIVHPGWRKGSWANDVALLRVNESFVMDGATVGPICVNPLKDHIRRPLLVAGWGRTRENHPRQPHVMFYTVLEPVSDKRCKKRYPYAFSAAEMFCAYGSGGRDTCQGDSGGAAAELFEGSYVLRGLISWGSGCARPHTPGVYTKVAPRYIEWIHQTILDKGSPKDAAQIRVKPGQDLSALGATNAKPEGLSPNDSFDSGIPTELDNTIEHQKSDI